MQTSDKQRVQQLGTALAAAERALQHCRAALERSQSALCAIADGIVVVDTDGRITCLNPVAAHLTGWTEPEALGRGLAEIACFSGAEGCALDVLSEGFPGDPTDNVSLTRRDGHVILVDGAVAAIHDSARRNIGSIVTFRNITAAARLTRELSYQASHDPLTGLGNRRAFHDHLRRALASAAELGCCHALLYMDLDRFKAVNDGGGHVAGDELLRQLARRLRSQLRDHDTVARLGGDEFAVLLENCSQAHASRVAEKIRTTIAEFEFRWHGRAYRVGTSIGQVEFSDDILSVDELVAVADRMCYVAKRGGRNRVARHRVSDADAPQDAHDVSHRPGARRDGSEPQRKFVT